MRNFSALLRGCKDGGLIGFGEFMVVDEDLPSGYD